MKNRKHIERWREIERLFIAASRLPKEQQRQFLLEECGKDESLRLEVEELVARTDESTRFFEKPAIELMAEQLADKTFFSSGSKLGHYELIGLMGAGGMGRVYTARDLNLDHVVAIKVLLPHHSNWSLSREQFLEEARAMIKLNHPNICRFFEFDFDRDVNYIVMEQIEGETLRSRLSRPITVNEFSEIAEQCLQALVEAHKKNILHRDIKPENIMLTADGKVKLCDFGLAKWLHSIEIAEKPERNSGVKGTIGYIAPEVWSGREPDARADVYSLGVVLYEILAGQRPFQNPPFVEPDKAETAVPLRKWNPEVSVRVEKIIDKMLRRDRNQRYSTAEDALADIRGTPSQWSRGFVRVAVALLAISIAAASADQLHEPVNVAVLPCAVVDATKEDGNFCNGLMEVVTREIITHAIAPRILFADPSDVRTNRVVTAEHALDRLGAQLIVVPTVRRTPEKQHLRLAVMRGSNTRPVFSEDFVVTSSDAGGLERTVGRSMAEMLGIALPPFVQEVATSPEASRFFLEGISLLQQYDDIDNVDKAIVSFSGAVGLAPGMSQAHARLGEAYVRKYEFSRHPEWLDLAKRACEKSLYLNRNLAPGRRCLAMLYNTAGEYYKAIDELNAAINAEPTDELNYRELAKAKERNGDKWGAETALKDAIMIRPDYWAPYASLGKFYTAHANYQEAAKAYEEAIRKSRTNILARFSLSETYAKLGRYDDAINVLKESIRYRPTHQAYSNLGNTLLRLRRFAEAAAELEQARSLNPRAFTQIGNLARAYYFMPGKREQSFAYYAEAIQLAQAQLDRVNPKDPDLHILLAWYNAMLVKPEESYRHLDQAMSSQSPPEFFWIAAIVYNQFGDTERALADLEKAGSDGFSKSEIQNTMEFDNLRDDPRFRRVIAQK
jgi:tetratricopeptide (TPR) repeat protein